ncbi:MAG: UDP-N-acetylglucosamine--N-acetylmuramyl-(pentapeptide) pyrophosphoryl-undecaprenol N-acetylglucosamine transferase [Synergistaceae bacterium]|nr:UDP-N-acetylglucosamine--N-acetylmuramyl-(pentapeptide) pyrophosphoryl-undecaprenol N-acetylglucosamine transferase [Synergistaceae bacterium]
MRTPERVLIVAGGTGGHILPATAFGSWIGERYPAVKVSYMSGRRPVELDIYRSLKIEPIAVDASGSPLGAPPGERLTRWKDLMRSFGQAAAFVRRDPPDLCVAFGGYVSAAAVLSSFLGRIPVVAHEQNALAGKVTLWARRLGARVASGWGRCDPLPHSGFTPVGVPVRPLPGMSRETAAGKLLPGLRLGDGPVVAVMTGSLGSGTLTGIIGQLSGLSEFASWNFLVIDPGAEEPQAASRNLIRLPRSWDIAPLFNLADILVTRGGASTLAEAQASGIPVVVVPWRGASGDHQMKNALEMAKAGPAEIFDETTGVWSLASMLANMSSHCAPDRKDIGKKMYNASTNICARLWSFCCAFLEGRD